MYWYDLFYCKFLLLQLNSPFCWIFEALDRLRICAKIVNGIFLGIKFRLSLILNARYMNVWRFPLRKWAGI